MTAALGTWLALPIALVLVGFHLLAPRIRRLRFPGEAATVSFAGGVAASYVFLHLLPELAEGNQAVGELLEDRLEPTPLTDLGIFLIALVGLLAFYGLERLARRGAHRDQAPPAGVYRLHLGAYTLYSALITYTMPLRLRTGVTFALLFALAMGLHFVLTDRGLEERHPWRFDRRGRYLLAAGLLAGWFASVVAAPTRVVVVSVLTALLALTTYLAEQRPPIP